ncbi:XdhC family protein [Thalassotalea sp. G2M2-11]|uniref:XdhC family protein n=1 Tax=Thalassotalea sp. G2M2-11 TaxID=2787627 RepID=UPI0019D1A1FE|nr:XdhC family protein [Thalassotalea sp. G2M2-11]
MQENWQQLIAQFEPSKAYVLATIVATQGSTYRKSGTMMLIDQQGQCTGLLSGGCLEADIALHAEQVFNHQQSKLLQYDLKADADLLWGLGLGCEGAIDILLQPLTPENEHLGFYQLIQQLEQRKSGFYCQRIAEQTEPKAAFIACHHDDSGSVKQALASIKHTDDAAQWLVTPMMPIFSILLCGAGPDAVPVVTMAQQLGWHITLQDHRDSHLAQPEFANCFNRRKLRAEHTTAADFIGFDGVIIMTHNLTSDGQLLKNALDAELGYIGLLGPAGRRDKLLNELSLTAKEVNGRVYGPIGLDLGGRSPQAIALSICAQIQQFISHQQQHQGMKSWYL